MSDHPSHGELLDRSELRKIVRKLENLPSIPAVAVKILKTLTEGEPEIPDIVKLIETDQATAMKILKLVNSAYYGVASDVSSIHTAVVMLGLSEVRCVLLSVTVSESFIKSLRNGNQEQDNLWKHSLACAVCAEMIADKVCPDLKAEAFVGGLLHDAGKLILEECFPDKFEQVKGAHTEQEISLLQAEQDVFGVDHCTVGKWLAEKWNLPEIFIQAIWLHHHTLSAIHELEFIKQKEVILTIHLADILAHEIMVDSRTCQSAKVDCRDILDFLHIKPADLDNLLISMGKNYSEKASILDFEEDEPSFYYHALQRANQKLADLASENARHLNLEETNRHLSVLHDLHFELSQIEDTEKVLSIIAQTIISGLKKPEGIIYMLKRAEKRLAGNCWFPGKDPEAFSTELDEQERPVSQKIPQLNDGLNRLIETCNDRFPDNAVTDQQMHLAQYFKPYLVLPLVIDGRFSGEIGFLLEGETDGCTLNRERLHVYRYLASVTETALSHVSLIAKMRETTESFSAALSKNSEMMLALKKTTAEKQKMEQEILKAQKLDSISTLAGGIAHDFNNILTAISGNISLAKMHVKPNEKAFEKLTQAEKAFLRARDLAKQLLTFSKKGVEPVKKIASIAELIKDSVGLALRGSNVRCEYSFSDNLLPVEVDEGQINQVLNNLIINADQAMPEGGTIKVTAENTILESDNNLPLSRGKYIKLTIEDQGTGISDADLLRIFDPYFTTKENGNGLGLSTAYSIIKKHEGHIHVESEPDVGTTFYIYLPASLKQCHEREIQQEKPFVGKGKILVMDDEKTIRDLTGEMLEAIGYRVDFARDGIEAVELYKTAKESRSPFDAVIIDLTVPGSMGGKETIQKLQQIDPQVRAIVSSGYVNDPVMVSFYKYGFAEAIAKPYKIAELSEMLYKTMSRNN